MGFHKFFADGKSESEAIDRTGFGKPVKLLKNAAEIFFRDATSPIGHGNLELIADYSALQLDRRPQLGKT